MQLNFSVKGLNGQAIINDRSISHSEYFLSFAYDGKRQYHLAIMFGAGSFVGTHRLEEFWLSAELPESVIFSHTATEPLEGLDYVGNLKHEIGVGADKEREIRFLNDISISLTSSNDIYILTATGKTLEEYSNGNECWNYEISVELRKEVMSILKNISSCATENA